MYRGTSVLFQKGCQWDNLRADAEIRRMLCLHFQTPRRSRLYCRYKHYLYICIRASNHRFHRGNNTYRPSP